MKRVLGMIPVALLSAGAFFSGTGLVYAADGDAVVIDESAFPDKVFRQYVLDKVDKNSDGELSQSEIDNCNGIFLSRDGYKNIENLKGLEYFTELERLGCEEQKLSSLDVSKNTKLTSLDCVSNNLSSLDISKNTKLTTLECDSNNLNSLDLSKNTELTFFSCYSNNLSSLDLSKNTKLTNLYCVKNNLTSLDMSKNTKLANLYCNSNNLSSLDLSKNTELLILDCSNNNLSNLDVSKNVILFSLDCSSNNLSNLDLSKNIELSLLSCGSNKLTDLDLSNNSTLVLVGVGESSDKISIPVGAKKIDIKLINPNIDVNRIIGVKGAELSGSYFINFDLDTPICYEYFTNQKNAIGEDIILSVALTITEDPNLDPVPEDETTTQDTEASTVAPV